MSAALEIHVQADHQGSGAAGHGEVDVALAIDPGEVVGLLGPAGGGASSVLRAVAGLGPRHRGTVSLRGTAWDDGGRRLRAPHERSVGLVLSDALLLPHLDVRTNIAVAIDGGAGGREAQDAAGEWVDALGLGDIGSVRAGSLPPGEAQMVAIARALARRPDVLLLDDPLANLSAGAAAPVRRLLARVLRRFTGAAVIVLGDVVDAHVLPDRVVVVEDGRVVQEGTAAGVTRRPATDWVAGWTSHNVYRGSVEDGRFTPDAGEQVLRVLGDVTGPAIARIPARAVTVHRGRPNGSPTNVWHGGVVAVEAAGGVVRVSVVGRLAVIADITPTAVADLELGMGGGVWVSIEAAQVEVLPA